MKWINVDDKLPDIGERCLIVELYGDGCHGAVMEAVRYQGKEFNRFGISCSPTHWMPLPSAPND
jgi:hypothetical protein